MSERQVPLDERPIGADFLFEPAHFAFVEREMDERGQDFVHPVGRAEDERAARPPEDAVVAERQVNRLDGEGVAGRRLHPVFAAFLLFVRRVRRAAGQEEKVEVVQRLYPHRPRAEAGRAVWSPRRRRSRTVIVEPGEDFRARRRGGKKADAQGQRRLRNADCGVRIG